MTPSEMEALHLRLDDLLREAINLSIAAVRSGKERHPLQSDPGDQVDTAQLDVERDSAYLRGERGGELIRQIRAALDRIEEGSYGICVDCGNEIELDRLRIIPWAVRCLDDEEAAEFRATDLSPSL